jgi:hypothetical protein
LVIDISKSFLADAAGQQATTWHDFAIRHAKGCSQPVTAWCCSTGSFVATVAAAARIALSQGAGESEARQFTTGTLGGSLEPLRQFPDMGG